MLVKEVAGFDLLQISALHLHPCGTPAHASSCTVICARGAACCRKGFKDPGSLTTASRRFLLTSMGKEYMWQSVKESCHILALWRANDISTVQRSILAAVAD